MYYDIITSIPISEYIMKFSAMSLSYSSHWLFHDNFYKRAPRKGPTTGGFSRLVVDIFGERRSPFRGVVPFFLLGELIPLTKQF